MKHRGITYTREDVLEAMKRIDSNFYVFHCNKVGTKYAVVHGGKKYAPKRLFECIILMQNEKVFKFTSNTRLRNTFEKLGFKVINIKEV